MAYREIRVRPVVRYVVTLHEHDYDADPPWASGSVGYGEFANVQRANEVALIMATAKEAVYEPARELKIVWLRGPGEPKEDIRWELVDVNKAVVGAVADEPEMLFSHE